MVDISKTYTPEEFFEKFDIEVIAYLSETRDRIEELFRKAKSIEVTISLPLEELGIDTDKLSDATEQIYNIFVDLLKNYNLNYFIIYTSPYGKEDIVNTIQLDISTQDIMDYVKDKEYTIKIDSLSYVIIVPEDKSKLQKILGRSVLSIYKPFNTIKNKEDLAKYIKENDRIEAFFEKFKEHLAILSL